MTDPDLPPWLVPFVAACFGVAWWAVLNVLARFGWHQLAKCYRAENWPEGESFSFRSAQLNSVNYGSCLRFTAGPSGLGISIQWPFRPGHPALFIPWSELSAREHRGWILQHVDFQCRQQPRVRLRVSRALADRLIDAGGHGATLLRVAPATRE